jgi:PIN domain nuclease of toxin-antitoxin system
MITITKRGRVVARLVSAGDTDDRTVPFPGRVEAAAHPRTVRLVPISVPVAAGIAALPPSFHRDPADRVIVATCRVLGAALVTKDRLIVRSRLVSRWDPRPAGD